VHPNLRVNAVVPGPVASPSRKVTHPGENAESLPAIETVVPAYLRLIGPAGRGSTGQIVDAAAG
jgi:NAD(P)-dependent dehydrogenase (short-subunit alcohol dehydrogenase family)